MKDQLNGLDVYISGKATVNDAFDRYISAKYDLRETTRSNYIYIYDRFIRNTFGRKNCENQILGSASVLLSFA